MKYHDAYLTRNIQLPGLFRPCGRSGHHRPRKHRSFCHHKRCRWWVSRPSNLESLSGRRVLILIPSILLGIFIALLLKGPKENRELVLQSLFQESSFVPQSVEAFLGFPVTAHAPSTTSISSQRTLTTSTAADGSTFSLANYGDVKEEEIDQVNG